MQASKASDMFTHAHAQRSPPQEENDSLKENYPVRSPLLQPPTPPRRPVRGNISPTTRTAHTPESRHAAGGGGGVTPEPSLMTTREFGIKGAEHDSAVEAMVDGVASTASAGRELSLKQLKVIL